MNPPLKYLYTYILIGILAVSAALTASWMIGNAVAQNTQQRISLSATCISNGGYPVNTNNGLQCQKM